MHLNGESEFKQCTNSYTAIAGKPAPTVFVAFTHFKYNKNPCGSWLASDEFNSVLPKKPGKKKRSPKAPLFFMQPA
ncbi:hypothetical protein DBR18_12465 [Pseudomonas sp. HMWF021]|nr:hypothetical protein DBR18_12465 [Pseudomonas sp. HMWF021]